MAASIATARPNYHHITGEQPVGHTQIAIAGDYAGTITKVKRTNTRYWAVIVRTARGAFGSNPHPGMACQVWFDESTVEFVVDYWSEKDWSDNQPVEAGRSHTLRTALGIAIDSAAQRGHQAGLW